ncbi:MAG: hypothetical protein JWO11_2091 [Nocardioides sp.]|nr:hypothetical protein [Nocardioides sp.]
MLVADPSNPYDKRAVAVFVDDLHVGYMEPGSTVQVTREEEHMEHLATLLSQFGSEMVVAGRTLMCRASLRGNALKADALHARTAHEFDDNELEELFATV